MPSFARVAVALTLSVVGVSTLTWAGWPRPRSVVAISAYFSVGFLDTGDNSTPPYRVIRHDDSLRPGAIYSNVGPESRASFWFLAPDGRVLGPWRAGGRGHPLGFDNAGRLLAEGSGSPGYQLGRYDPETGREETLVTLDGPNPCQTQLSGDLSTLAVVWHFPLTFDIYDLADGRKRARLTFPDRAGGIYPWLRPSHGPVPPIATLAWALSPDGRELLLANAWAGGRHVGPPGVEVYDVATGRLARRLEPKREPVVSLEPPAFGFVWTTLLGEGEVADYLSAQANEWVSWDKSSRKGHDGHRYSGKPRLTLSGRRECEVASHGGHALWLRADPAEFCVRGPGSAPAADWQPLPGGLPKGVRITTRPQPGRPAVVHSTHHHGTKPLPPWLGRLARQLGRPPDRDVSSSEYLYHDWSTGEFRRVHAVPTGRQTSAVGPNDLAILTPTPAGATLTMWDLPPPRLPWPWSVPAGVALGVLLTTAGVRLRRLRGGPTA